MFKSSYNRLRLFFYVVTFLISSIILGTLIVFVTDERVNVNGIDKDMFGQFGDFIGGVAGTLINFTGIIFLWLNYNEQKRELADARKLVQLQINLSLKPDLYFIRTPVYVYSVGNTNGVTLPLDPSNVEYLDDTKYRHHDFSVNLVNVGVATAKNIQYNWEFDLDDVKHFLEENFDVTTLVLELKGNAYCEIGIIDGSSSAVGISFYKDSRIHDIILPYKGTEEIVKIPYPLPYFKLLMAAINFSFKEGKFDGFKSIPGFPEAMLHLKYVDMADNVHYKRFKFILNFGSFSHVTKANEVVLQGEFYGQEIKGV